MTIFTIIIIIFMFSAVVFSWLVTVGYDNFKGITLQLDQMYNNTAEMAYATVRELREMGKECEIIELDKGYPKLLVNGKKYILTYKMASIYGFPTQVVQLRFCRK